MRRIGSGVYKAIALLLLSQAPLGHAAPPPRTISFALAAQPLSDALNALAAQSNLRIVFNTDDTQGLRSERVVGAYTTRTALQLLLGSSDLTYQFVDERTVEIRSGRHVSRTRANDW